MKHNWNYKQIGEVCSVVGGSTPKTDIEEFWGGELNWFTPAEIDERKYYDESERKITPEAVKASGLTLLPAGTVLLTSRAPIGKIGILTQGGYCNQGFKNLICNECLYNEYLYYVLLFFNEEIKGKGRGSTFKEISKKITESIEIPVPPLKVQEQIVAEFDKIIEIIRDCKEAIRNLDALAQSLFYDYFGDPIINHNKRKSSPLNNLCTVTSSNRIFADEYCENGIPFYRGKEVSELSRGENISTELYISKERYELLKVSNNIPQINDILITAVGTIGNIWIVNSTKPFYFKDGNIIWLKDMDYASINSVYFKYFLKKLIRDEKEKMANGSAYKALTIQKLKKTNVILPPLAHQQKFAARIEQIEQQKKDLEETIANMQTLLNCRMDYWFN